MLGEKGLKMQNKQKKKQLHILKLSRVISVPVSRRVYEKPAHTSALFAFLSFWSTVYSVCKLNIGVSKLNITHNK